MAPLLVLFEGSILFASLLDRRAARARAREEAEDGRRGRRRAPPRPGRELDRCCSTSEAAAGAAPSRSSTSAGVLMGGGLVLFGIGGGGACRAASSTRSPAPPAATPAPTRFDKRRARPPPRPRSATRRTPPPGPRSPAPACRRAGVGDIFDPNTGEYTDAGKAKLAAAAEAWEKYLALDPKQARRPRRRPDGAARSTRPASTSPTRPPRRRRSSPRPARRRRPTRTLAISPTRPARPARATSRARRPSSCAPTDEREHAQGSARPGQAAGARPAVQQRQGSRPRRRPRRPRRRSSRRYHLAARTAPL